MKKFYTVFSSIFIAVFIILSSTLPAASQVVHEDPAKLYPSSSTSVNEQLTNVVDYMLALLELTSEDIKANNFEYANESFYYFNMSCDDYLSFLRRMNMSRSDYEAIAGNLNFTREELAGFIADAAAYNSSYLDYNEFADAGNSARENASARQVKASYENITVAYDHFRANSTLIAKVLESNDVDTTPYENAMNNLNSFMGQISSEYNQPGLANNSTDLRLTIDPYSVPVGGKTRITAVWIAEGGAPVNGSDVKVYFNNHLTGTIVTDASGTGVMNYTVPVNVTSDTLRIHAEAVPRNTSDPRVFSNEVILNVPDMDTKLTLFVDKDTISYGDSLLYSGKLAATDGTSAPGKAIAIYFDDDKVGSTVTDANGSYTYRFNVTPLTPSGRSIVDARYDRRPNGVFLGSTSPSHTVTVTPKNTALTLYNDSEFNIGDLAHVRGVLKTDDGKPVAGANIQVYVDDRPYGNNTTMPSGAYDVVVRVPSNATTGDHELYTRFAPENGTALRGSASDRLRVTFNDRVQMALVQGLPPVLFKDDVLNVNGTLTSGSGMPIADRSLIANLTGIQEIALRTDENGSFNLSYLVTDTTPFGVAQVAVYDEGAGGLASPALYSSQTLVVPYDKLPVLGGLLVLIAAIAAAGYFLLRPGKNARQPRQILVEPNAPEKAIQKPGIRPAPASLGTDKNKVEVLPPFVIEGPIMMPTPEAPAREADGRARVKPARPVEFSFEGEIGDIKAQIGKGKPKEALTLVYLASRKLAAVQGVDVPDSMTHGEFYAAMAASHPELAGPLSYIVTTYEKVGFARAEVSNADLNTVVNGLKELYVGLVKKEDNN